VKIFRLAGYLVFIADTERSRMLTSRRGLHRLGYICNTMEFNNKKLNGKSNKKFHNSSDCFLQLENMKEELLVIAYQASRGEYVPGLRTNRPSRPERRST